MNFDPEIVMAYVDGELDLVTAKRVEKAMETDAALASRVAAERALRAKLSAHFDPVAADAVPDRLTAMLAGVDTSLSDRRERKQRRFGFGPAQWGAVAASLALGLFIGQTNIGKSDPVASRGGALFASGNLETALDTQLASTQPRDAAIRIGLTFRDAQGAVCRSFDQAATSGIACRSGGGWRLRRTISGTVQGTDYRQAGSSEIGEAASRLMNGDPFDADAERAALQAGWK